MAHKEFSGTDVSTYAEVYLETTARKRSPDTRINDPLSPDIHISLVIPAYQEEKTIQSTLKSLGKQSFKPFEVIVVDNGSHDKTRSVVSGFSANHHVSFPVYLIEENLPGPGNARKTGMDEVVRRVVERDRGTLLPHIIATTDADVVFPEGWIGEMVTLFSKSHFGAAGGAHTGMQWVDDTIEDVLGIPNYFLSVALFNKEIVNRQIGKIKLSGPNSVFSAEAYIASGGMQQPQNENGNIELKEVSRLADRISSKSFPIVQLDNIVRSSRRRHLLEIIKGKDMYMSSSKTRERFITIRPNEQKLLEFALEHVPLEQWQQYQIELFSKILTNTIINPFFNNEVDSKEFCDAFFNLNGTKRSKAFDTARKYNVSIEQLENTVIAFLTQLYSN